MIEPSACRREGACTVTGDPSTLYLPLSELARQAHFDTIRSRSMTFSYRRVWENYPASLHFPSKKRAPWVLRCGPISTTSQLALMPRPTSRSPMRRSHLRLNPSPCRERGCWHGCERVPYRAGRRYRTKTCLSGSVYRHTSGFAAGPLGVPAQTSSRQTLSPSAQAPARSDLHHVRL